MSTMVRAAVMKAPGRLEVERFPLPDPKPGAVVGGQKSDEAVQIDFCPPTTSQE
jgi:hypothetical protein